MQTSRPRLGQCARGRHPQTLRRPLRRPRWRTWPGSPGPFLHVAAQPAQSMR